jgi:hypothetical protein
VTASGWLPLTFLDDSVTASLESYSELAAEGLLTEQARRSLAAGSLHRKHDVVALCAWYREAREVDWPVVVQNPPRPGLEADLAAWAADWLPVQRPTATAGLPYQTAFAPFLDTPTVAHFIRSSPARVQVEQALSRRCEVFVTMRYRDLLPHRPRLATLGLRVQTPAELLRWWFQGTGAPAAG